MNCSWCGKPIEGGDYIYSFRYYYHYACFEKKQLIDLKGRKHIHGI